MTNEVKSVQEAELEDTLTNLMALQAKLLDRKQVLEGAVNDHDCKYDALGTHGCECADWTVELMEVGHRLDRVNKKLWS